MPLYRTLEGETLDLDTLPDEEQAYLRQVLLSYGQDARFVDFTSMMFRPGNPILKGGRLVTAEVSASTLYRVAEDLRYRLGIRQGELAPEPGDDVTTEPLGPEEWIPVSEAARQKGVTTVAIYRALKENKLLAYSKPEGYGTFVSRSSLERYQPSAVRQKAGRIARSKKR